MFDQIAKDAIAQGEFAFVTEYAEIMQIGKGAELLSEFGDCHHSIDDLDVVEDAQAAVEEWAECRMFDQIGRTLGI